MKLIDFWNYTPINHYLVPTAAQGFTVGARGVVAIETCTGGVIVTLIPGDGKDGTENDEPVQLFVNTPGAGQIATAERFAGEQKMIASQKGKQ